LDDTVCPVDGREFTSPDPADPDDSTLLALASSGDRQALEALCRRNWRPVYRSVARYAADPGEAEDLTQEVFLRALRAFPQFADTGVPYTATYLAWLHVTAGGSFNIRVKPVPASWATPSLVTGSCATGSDCYVETDGSSAGNYYGPMIETTDDDGLTWTSTPMYPPDQSEIGIYLSCPVPGGCIAVAGDSTEQSSTWVVLSNLRNAG
jgi:hypothetical protein